MLITSSRPKILFIFALFLDVFYQRTIKAAYLPVRKTSDNIVQENVMPNYEDDATLDKIVVDSLVSSKFNVHINCVHIVLLFVLFVVTVSL